MRRLHKGNWYWSTSREAQNYADKHGLTRVIKYGLGWAVQLRPSGPYAGPWLEPDIVLLDLWGKLDKLAKLSNESRASYAEDN